MGLYLGALLENSWRHIFAVMQQLVQIVNPPNPDSGLGHAQIPGVTRQTTRSSGTGGVSGHKRGDSGGSVGAGQAHEIITLGSLMAQLFDSSQLIGDSGLGYIVQALIDQSEHTLSSLGGANQNRALLRNQAHLFPVVKLLHVSLRVIYQIALLLGLLVA